jgi:hypothetical protein
VQGWVGCNTRENRRILCDTRTLTTCYRQASLVTLVTHRLILRVRHRDEHGSWRGLVQRCKRQAAPQGGSHLWAHRVAHLLQARGGGCRAGCQADAK